MSKKQIALVDLKLKEILRKGEIKRTQPFQGEFLRNLFLVGNINRKLLPCNQSRIVEPVRSFSPFQNGRPFSVKAFNAGRRMDVGTGPKGCLL